MAQSIEAYIKAHPGQAAPGTEMQETAETYQEEQERQDTADRLKLSILQQLEQGNAPQYPLLTAIKAIGILSNDAEFSDKAAAILAGVYGDLEQQSIDTDKAAADAANLEKMQAEYRDKLQKRLEKELKAYKRFECHLLDTLKAVKLLNPEQAEKAPEEPTEPQDTTDTEENPFEW